MTDQANALTGFAALFARATGNSPFKFQKRFAEELPPLVRVPTGAGKTAMAILGWLWRRRFAAHPAGRAVTPRRLVYCLPMRVLVEQTRDNAVSWLDSLGLLAHSPADATPADGWTAEHGGIGHRISVSVLMGGEERDEWDLYPERDAILVGTQDMLLSRALNRGYGMNRFRWPMQFALLNNDALWVFDEIQLMGSGLATTAQLVAFRSRLGTAGPSRSVWMSATLEPAWLRTVDFAPPADQLALSEEDLAASDDLRKRMTADKPLFRASARAGMADDLAKEILSAHQEGSRTLVVVNTVDQAREIWQSLDKAQRKAKKPALVKLVLLHSRFRPADRARRIGELMAEPAAPGTIIVATQVVEAGVDVSAKVLFTALAPWASLVQRFGRCNRRGKDADAKVYWIDWPEEVMAKDADKKRDEFALPYRATDLMHAREQLARCQNLGPTHLPKVPLPYEHTHVIRRKDFVELFDTTPDLAGNDIDVGRYVREIEDSDVQVFWRDLKGKHAEDDEPFPRREELCSVQISALKAFLAKLAKKEFTARLRAYRRNFLEKSWEVAAGDMIYPGQVLMLDANAGGYDELRGWTGEPGVAVASLRPVDRTQADEGMDDDSLGRQWESIAGHTDAVCRELDAILRSVEVPEATLLKLAGRWHDRGKAHATFQDAAAAFATSTGSLVARLLERREVAKTGGAGRLHYRRAGQPAKHFRHELASALAILLPSAGVPAGDRDLLAYLVAAHHGKVRLSIRSMPGELRPAEVRAGDGRLFARGVWHNDGLPETDLGGGVIAPPVALSLEPMELGRCENGESPLYGQPSWTERMLALLGRSDLGPFRLVFLETLLRAADQRASGPLQTEPRSREDAHAAD